MNDIMTMVKTFEEYGLLIKDVSQTVKNETKEKTKISRKVIRHFSR